MTSPLTTFYFSSYQTNIFPVVMFLSSDRSQKTSTCGKNIGNSPGRFSCTALLLLPHFHVSCNILFGRRTASHNLFIKWSEKVSAIKNHFVFTWTWSSIPSISFFAGAIIWAIGVDAICIHVTDRFVTFAFINIWVKVVESKLRKPAAPYKKN